jgi:hypothetical protein
MSINGASHYYDELQSDPESPVTSAPAQDTNPETQLREKDLEAGDTVDELKPPSGLSRAFQSLRWKRAVHDEGVPEKAEPVQKTPEYTEEARKLVRSFTRVHFDSETKQNR